MSEASAPALRVEPSSGDGKHARPAVSARLSCRGRARHCRSGRARADGRTAAHHQGLINLIAVVGLYVFAGNSGVLSFGNVAFMAIGAIRSALLTMPAAAKGVFLPDLPAWLAAA